MKRIGSVRPHLTLLIPGFLDPCSTGGGVPPLRKVANVADMRTKLGKTVYSNKIYTISYFFHFSLHP